MRKERTKCNLFIKNEGIGNKVGSPQDDSLRPLQISADFENYHFSKVSI